MGFELNDRYKSLHKQKSGTNERWVEAAPAVPYIGTNYGKEGLAKVLVYGSAENLNYDHHAVTDRFDRNQLCYDQWLKDGAKGFPQIHMSPVKDGSLLTAARYILELHKAQGFSKDPHDFINQIAVGNYGKFSLKGKRNSDYASKPDLLAHSDAYVLADLEVLQPDIIILPRSIYLSRLNALLEKHAVDAVVFGIYQTNAGNINRQIKKQLVKHGIQHADRSGWAQDWTKEVKGLNMGMYLDWLDWRFSGKAPGWGLRVR